jgi:hypothetical protein
MQPLIQKQMCGQNSQDAQSISPASVGLLPGADAHSIFALLAALGLVRCRAGPVSARLLLQIRNGTQDCGEPGRSPESRMRTLGKAVRTNRLKCGNRRFYAATNSSAS